MPASADAAAFEMIQQARTQLLAKALRLVTLSVAFGLVSGVLSVTVGLFDGSSRSSASGSVCSQTSPALAP